MTRKELKEALRPHIKLSKAPYQEGLCCTYCRRSMDPPGSWSLLEATKDHPQPKSRSGGGITVWACYTCNHIKGDMSFASWLSYTETHRNWWEKRKLVRGEKKPMRLVVDNKEEVGRIELPQRKEPMLKLDVIDGGLPPSTGNWLMDLPIGTKFTVRSKTNTKNFMLLDLELVNKTPRTAVVWECTTGQPLGGNGRVEPLRFVLEFDKVEILPSLSDMFDELKEEKEPTETTDGNSDRSNPVVTN